MSRRAAIRARRGALWAALLAVVATLSPTIGARAEVTATHNTIIRFASRIFPRALPRGTTRPVGIEIEGHVKARKGREPAALTSLELAIHHAADLVNRGLPVCDIARIDPASSAQALAACPGAQIGYGEVRATSSFPGTPQFHFHGRVIIFNGRLEDGRRAILLHVFNPVLRTSFVFPLTISHRSGRYRTVLSTHVRIGRWSSITDFRLVLNRTYRYHGRPTGFLNASCPAPRGFSLGVSPFVVATLGFADATKKKIAVVGSCRVAQ